MSVSLPVAEEAPREFGVLSWSRLPSFFFVGCDECLLLSAVGTGRVYFHAFFYCFFSNERFKLMLGFQFQRRVC